MLILKIFFACVARWFHVVCRGFMFDFKHRQCSLMTNTNEIFYLKIYCECGKIFGEWKNLKEEKK